MQPFENHDGFAFGSSELKRIRVSPAFQIGTLAGNCNDSSDIHGFSSRIGSPEDPKNSDNDDKFDLLGAIVDSAIAADNDTADFAANDSHLSPDL